MLQHYRIDAAHSNAYTAWKKMGSPQDVTDEQYRSLEQEGQLQLLNSPEWMTVNKGAVTIRFSLPRQGVSLIKLNY